METFHSAEILKALIDAAPQTIKLPLYDDLPLHLLLTLYRNDRECHHVDEKIKAKLVLVLLEAFPDSINILLSADPYRCSMDILKIITERAVPPWKMFVTSTPRCHTMDQSAAKEKATYDQPPLTYILHDATPHSKYPHNAEAAKVLNNGKDPVYDEAIESVGWEAE
eukprot:gene34398-44438_t